MDLQKSTTPEADPVIAHAHTQASHISRPSLGERIETDITESRSTLEDSDSASEKDIEKADFGNDEAPQQHPNECTCGFHPKNDLVEFVGPDDPGNPKNWPRGRRWGITVSMGAMTFVVTFSSSIFSVAIPSVAEEYNVGRVVSTLGITLFLLGFVFGPVFFGPASEAFGRRVPLHFGYILFAIFQIPVAVARNVETIMLGRFFGGFFASAPLAVVGGAMADIWDPIDRAYAICIFAGGAFCGPVAGPIMGGFITQSHLGWRWTSWITLIMASLFGLIGLFVIPETSAARILQIRAKEMRYKTGNWALHAKADEHHITAKSILNVYLMRPFIMFVKEPILALITAYMSFIYGILYLLFEAYPISFGEERGWNLGVASLPFVSFVVGIMMGTGVIAYSTRTNFAKAFKKHGRPIPEERLPPMIIGAVVLPIGLFWFAWTSNPNITWVPQVLSSALIGMGCLVTFWQGMNYIIDCYGFYSNSAIAVNTFIRSIAGAGFPLFAPAMYHKLGVPWATSLLAFLCTAFLPVPVLFYMYGAKIRQRSTFTPTG
ncbi:MFS transporter [Rhizodiscina lignyota]|uniref:MFS transporter n=1 Tax=Rhizodiscina lignyota TaxID=1504668 RepID=A0A9P4IMW1_9PEZI|nr:MFS transporter [Rhizodiscina lignyota]